MESMGYVEIEVFLSGGTSDIPFTLTVTLSEQTPMPAEGKFASDLTTYLYICITT